MRTHFRAPAVALLAFAIACSQGSESDKGPTAPQLGRDGSAAISTTAITVTKSPASQTVRRAFGGTFTFTISVTNGAAATRPAVSTQLTDQLGTFPGSGLTWSLGAISWGTETCAIDASNLLTCGTGTDNPLAPGATFSVVVNGVVPPGATGGGICGFHANQSSFTHGDVPPRFVVLSNSVSYRVRCD